MTLYELLAKLVEDDAIGLRDVASVGFLLAIVPELAEIALGAPPLMGGLAFVVLIILTTLCVGWIYGGSDSHAEKRRKGPKR